MQALVLTELPKVAPFEAAKVRLTGFGNVRAKKRLRAPQVSFLPRLQCHIHVRSVGFGLGLLESYGATVLGGEWKDVFAFTILVLVLMFRPTGILGEQIGRSRA